MTNEQTEKYIAALEEERKGYVARAANVKAGRQDPLTAEQLDDRVKQVDAEIKRAKKG